MTEQEMTEQWLEGCAVQRIMFRDGLVLNFDDYNELVISVPLQLTLPAIETSPAEGSPSTQTTQPTTSVRSSISPGQPAQLSSGMTPEISILSSPTVIRSTCTPMIASPHGNCMANTTDTPRAWRQASCELCGMT